MKRKELIAAVLFAAVLTGCTPGASKELAGNESSQEISIDNTVEAAIEASSEVVVEAPVEVSVDESVAEASVEEIKAERPEKANSDYPFLFIDINWDTSRNVSVYELGFKSGEESSVTSTLLSNSYGDTVVFQNCKGEEDFSMVNLFFVDEGLGCINLHDDNGADRLAKYKELFINYYGEPDVKTDDNTAFMWYTDECIATLDAFPNFDGDSRLEISYMPAAKSESDKEKAKMLFDAQHGTVKVEITTN